MNRKIINQILIIIILITALLLGMIESNEATSLSTNDIGVEYYSHIQDFGWEKEYEKADAETSGTTGQNKKLEAIKIQLKNAPQNAKIEYQAHVSDIGWQKWVENGNLAGTTGQNRKMEAIRIRLVNLEDYTVRYRAHVQDIGWQDWVEDGEVAGTTGKALKIEAIEIEIVPKKAKTKINFNNELNNKTYYAEGIQENGTYSTNLENSIVSLNIDGKDYTKNITVTENTNTEEQIKIGNGLKTYNFKINIDDLSKLEDGKHTLCLQIFNQAKTVEIGKIEKNINIDKGTPHIIYSSHIENIAWQNAVQDGETSGTTGKNLKLQAIKINIKNMPENVKLQYQMHVENIGWQSWVNEGEMAGTTGKNLKAEAIKIKLTGTSNYSVEYRTHVENIGWQDWVRDGDLAGTTGRNLKIEALEIRIVPKEPKATIQMETDLEKTTFYSDGISIKGWYLANIPNTKMKITLDGEAIDQYVTQSTRDDIYSNNESFGGKENTPKPGFQITMEDVSKLESGKHQLTVTIYKEDGETILQTKTYEINLDKEKPHIRYSVHMQDIGWLNNYDEGETAGDINKNTKIEAIKIDPVNFQDNISIEYQAHIQDIGWEKEWKKAGEQSGTTGQNKKIEAIRIRLVGTDKYSVAYRAYVENSGWQDWAYDGEYAGTVANNLKLKAIEIKITPKYNEKKIRLTLEEPSSSASIINEVHNISGWVMTNIENTKLRISIDNKEIAEEIQRKERTDVINAIKGYGGDIENKTPGFVAAVNFANYSIGTHSIKVEVLNEKNEVVTSYTRNINVKNKIVITTGTYGISGLKAKGDSRGDNLTYYQYGSGPNVFFATFCVHGFEDAWGRDGTELTLIANAFWNRLTSTKDQNLANKWTIYIIPEVNPDGRRQGWTNNGPGRTTLFSQAPVNKGIDINRNWSTEFQTLTTSDRNYTGTAPFQAYESIYLRDFLLTHKSQNGQTVLVDLHGWTQQLIGDEGIRNYYRTQFPENIDTATYGRGYLINWARTNLGSNGRTARAALIELPTYINSPQAVISNNITERYISATLSMLNGIV